MVRCPNLTDGGERPSTEELRICELRILSGERGDLFRVGSGWGLPGGFLEAGEQPLDALRRELREEIGLEVEHVEVFAARSFKKPQQVEVLFRCRASGQPAPRNIEVERAVWFSPESLPEGLPNDQRLLVERAVSDGANRRD